MHTSESKYLAKMFYSTEYINKVLDKNKISPPKESTDANGNPIIPLDNEVTLKKVHGDTFVGYLIKVDNPNRISLVAAKNNQGEKVEEIIKSNKADGGINACGYKKLQFQGIANGISIIDGKAITTCDQEEKHLIGGVNKNGKLIVGEFTNADIAKQHYIWAAESAPILIVNGKKVTMTRMAGGLAPRTAIGQTKDGAILLLVLDGRQIASVGASYYDTQTVLFENGAINAFNLDGGSSSSMFYKNSLVNNPCKGNQFRNLPNALLILKK